MTLQTFLALLGDPLDGTTSDSLYDDTFAVLAHRPPPRNLGFIDRTSSTLSVTVNGQEFAIKQSPQLLKSQRAGGTTGAVVWFLTPLLASFLTSPTNPLAVHGILTPQATVLELGSGVSSIMALSFAVALPSLRPARIVLSDQEYVLKIARQNVEDNLHEAGQWEKVREDVRPTFVSYKVTRSSRKPSGRENRRLGKSQAKFSPKESPISRAPSPSASAASNLVFPPPLTLDLISFDWEQDSLNHHPAFSQDHGRRHISLVIAVDCIYNESLIPHLIETCVDACSLPSNSSNHIHPAGTGNENATLVLIALELRSPDVLECFLERFAEHFRVWRIPDSLLSKELRTGADAGGEEVGSGHAIYCGVLRENVG